MMVITVELKKNTYAFKNLSLLNLTESPFSYQR